MLTREILVTIPGPPEPKGSLKCVGARGKGGRHVLVEDNPQTKVYREKVARIFRLRVVDEGHHADPQQPIGVEVTFTKPRPKSVRRAWPSVRGTDDVDKLARTLLDALEDAGIVANDSQVCELIARKVYPRPDAPDDTLAHAGIRVRLYPLEDPRETP